MDILQKHHIHFDSDQFNALNKYITDLNPSKILVLTDTNTHLYCYPLIKNKIPAHESFIIQDGEQHKNLDTCIRVWDKMTSLQMDRHALLINLGGGVIGDMGGFCAATYKRGIPFISVPTTLLSMVDASVGGKLGIDYQGFKNHIGVFQEPYMVCINHLFLKTLTERELKSGYAEVIKHALIKDVNIWQNLIKHTWNDVANFDYKWHEIIKSSVTIKAHVVDTDIKEAGERKILNFGHTIGHAIETYFLNTPHTMLHGEAVACGMVCESYLSVMKKFITEKEFGEILRYLKAIYPIKLPSDIDIEEIFAFCIQDKKNNHGNINFSVLKAIGNCTYNITFSASEIKESIKFLINI